MRGLGLFLGLWRRATAGGAAPGGQGLQQENLSFLTQEDGSFILL